MVSEIVHVRPNDENCDAIRTLLVVVRDDDDDIRRALGDDATLVALRNVAYEDGSLHDKNHVHDRDHGIGERILFRKTV